MRLESPNVVAPVATGMVLVVVELEALPAKVVWSALVRYPSTLLVDAAIERVRLVLKSPPPVNGAFVDIVVLFKALASNSACLAELRVGLGYVPPNTPPAGPPGEP